MSPHSLRSRPGAGSFHSAAPDFLHCRSPYEATCRLIASRLRRSMGLVRWPAKPASRLRWVSSSLPNPLGAISVTARHARRLRINSRPLPSGRPRSLMSRSRSSAPAAFKAAARLPAVRAVWPRWCKRQALTAEVARSSRIEGTKRPDRVWKSRVELRDYRRGPGRRRGFITDSKIGTDLRIQSVRSRLAYLVRYGAGNAWVPSWVPSRSKLPHAIHRRSGDA